MRKKIRDRIALAAVLLVLTMSCACVYGQGNGTDGFFNNGGGYRNGDDDYNGASWDNFGGDGTGNGASWDGFGSGDITPVGGGLLILAASGACYAGIKRFKDSKVKIKRLEK